MRLRLVVLVSTFFMLAACCFLLPACNESDRPIGPGAQFAPTPIPCNGVIGHNTAELGTAVVDDLWFIPVSPTLTTTLVNLSVYTASSSATPVTFEAGVYSDSSGSPGSLIAETGPRSVNGPATLWNTAPLIHNASLSSGVTYWLAFQSSNYSYRYTTATTAYAYQPAGAYGALPANFSGTPNSGYVLSIYGTTCP